MEGRNRKLNRWQGFDYSQTGFYFVTICTHKKIKWFGTVKNGQMVLNKWGEIVYDCWMDLPNHYPNCELDEFVVIPNHVHGIIIIADRRERSVTVPSNNNPVFSDYYLVPPDDNRVVQRTGAIKQSPGGDRNGYKPFPTRGHGLSEFMRGFKTFSSKRINQTQNEFLFQWQKSFHDHVIRNEIEFYNIQQYIVNNPANWETDRNNPESGASLPSG